MAELTNGFKIKIRKDFSITMLFLHIAGILDWAEDGAVKIEKERKTTVAD